MTVVRTSSAVLRRLVASALVAALFCVAVAAANAGPSLSSKQAQAQGILSRLQQLDAAAQVANSRYQLASAKLQLLHEQLSQSRQALGVARANLAAAQKALSQRLVAIYTTQDEQSSLSVILGARSLNDLVSRVETVHTVTSQNTAIIREVTKYQRAILRHQRLLREARRSAARLVRARAAAKNEAAAKLAAEQSLYNSVRAQIAQLKATQHPVAAPPATTPPIPGVGGGVLGGLPPERYSAAVGIAEKYLGVPYVWGGASPSGFDCSGLVMYVYAQLGVSLPHYTVSQYSYPNAVHPSRSQLQPGDLVFFAGLGHVGIYIGGNEFIHAPHTGAVVEIDSMTGWYSSEYYGATRILG